MFSTTVSDQEINTTSPLLSAVFSSQETTQSMEMVTYMGGNGPAFLDSTTQTVQEEARLSETDMVNVTTENDKDTYPSVPIDKVTPERFHTSTTFKLVTPQTTFRDTRAQSSTGNAESTVRTLTTKQYVSPSAMPTGVVLTTPGMELTTHTGGKSSASMGSSTQTAKEVTTDSKPLSLATIEAADELTNDSKPLSLATIEAADETMFRWPKPFSRSLYAMKFQICEANIFFCLVTLICYAIWFIKMYKEISPGA